MVCVLSLSPRLSESVTGLCFVRIRIFTDDTSNDIHSAGPVIWEVSP